MPCAVLGHRSTGTSRVGGKQGVVLQSLFRILGRLFCCHLQKSDFLVWDENRLNHPLMWWHEHWPHHRQGKVCFSCGYFFVEDGALTKLLSVTELALIDSS